MSYGPGGYIESDSHDGLTVVDSSAESLTTADEVRGCNPGYLALLERAKGRE